MKTYQLESAMGVIDSLGGIDAVVQYLEGKIFFKARLDKRDFMRLHNPRSTQNIYNSLGKLYKFFESELGIFEREGESNRPMYIKLDGAAEKLRTWYKEHKNNGRKTSRKTKNESPVAS